MLGGRLRAYATVNTSRVPAPAGANATVRAGPPPGVAVDAAAGRPIGLYRTGR
jgi:hypothetical protein